MTRAEHTREVQAAYARVIDRDAHTGAREVFARVQEAAARGARASAAKASATAPHYLDARNMAAAVRTATVAGAPRLLAAVLGLGAGARGAALHQLVRFVGRAGSATSALADPALHARVNAARAADTEARARTAVKNMVLATNAAVRDAAREAVRRGATAAEVLADIDAAVDAQRWRLDRIVRTEAAYAFNSASHDGIVSLASATPGTMARWTELVDDATWAPLDPRVAADSLVLHGQLAQPGGSFTMPDDGNVSSKVWGKSWQFPPNRPNDRAIVLPWAASWGAPGWTLRHGHKVWLVRRS